MPMLGTLGAQTRAPEAGALGLLANIARRRASVAPAAYPIFR
jgi:hypothetical protein